MPEKISHFRGKPRPGRTLSLRYREIDGEGAPAGDEVAAVTRNIGPGGAFIICDRPPAPGARLRLTLALPDGELGLDGEVRWLTGSAAAGGDAAAAGAAAVGAAAVDDETGMGVQFVGLPVHAVLALGDYFASLTGRGRR